METRFIEASNSKAGGGNWGKFLLGRFTEEEWGRRSKIGGRAMLHERGWTPQHILVLDLQTGEGAIFYPKGYYKVDLNDKHQLWICPLFEPFLKWLYEQDLSDFTKLPEIVEIDNPDTAMYGYRRKRKQNEK